MTREARESAAAEVERHALNEALFLMQHRAPAVETVALIGRAMAEAAAIRAGAVDPHPGGTP